MSERVWTAVEILNAARHYLEQKGIENARGDAEALLGKTLHLPRIELYLQHDRPLTAEEISDFRELLRRRARREPLQLLLGQVEFCGVTLEVVPGLLIPRPETEELAERVISELRSGTPATCRVLDIGTGTGCLAVAIAAQIPQADVDAVDVDFEAVRCAERNAARNGVSNRVRALLVDLFSPRFETMVRPPYDAVVSNPPYVSESDATQLPPEVRNHEARHALIAPEAGLAFYRRIVELIPALLGPGGLLAVEIGYGQVQPVTEMLRGRLDGLTLHNDVTGIPRIVMGRKPVELRSNRPPL
jgi:release factor glutamine methyltransferase